MKATEWENRIAKFLASTSTKESIVFQTLQTGNFKIKTMYTVCFLSWNTTYFCNTEWCLWKLPESTQSHVCNLIQFLFSLRSRPAWNKLLNFLETDDTLDQVSGNNEFFTWNGLGCGDIHKQLNFSFLGYVFISYAKFQCPIRKDSSANLAAANK